MYICVYIYVYIYKDCCGCSTKFSGRFTPGNDALLILHEVGWSSGSVWACAENLDPRPPTHRVATPTKLSRPHIHIFCRRSLKINTYVISLSDCQKTCHWTSNWIVPNSILSLCCQQTSHYTSSYKEQSKHKSSLRFAVNFCVQE